MRLQLVVVVLGLLATQVKAPGTVRGCVTDRHGGVLPGVDVVATSTAGPQARAVTDATGNYELRHLPEGSYSIMARLTGFVDSTRESLTVTDGGTTVNADFVLCSVIEEIDWPKTSLGELWRIADAVVRLRISGAGTRHTGCPNEDFEHTGVVLEVFKNDGGQAVGGRVTFAQENWRAERTPYPVGQEMVIFLAATPLGYRRAAGPHATFVVEAPEYGQILGAVRKWAKGSGLTREPNTALHPTGAGCMVIAGG